MSELLHASWPDCPSLVISHSSATDEIGRSLEALVSRAESFRFLAHSDECAWDIAAAVTSVLEFRNAVMEPGAASGNGSRRCRPIAVQLCAAAEMAACAQRISQATKTIRGELDRSLLCGTVVLLVYVGPVGGMLPGKALVDDLARAEDLVDLIVLVSDSDTKGRRYRWDDTLWLMCRFLHGLLGVRAFCQFLFDAARRHDPRNRRITFGLGRLDVSVDAFRALLLEHLSQVLFGMLFPVNDTDEPSETRPTDLDYLSARHRSSGGALAPVVSALTPIATQLTSDWKKARAQELTEQTGKLITAPADRFSRTFGRRFARVASFPYRLLGRKKRENAAPEVPETHRLREEKAKVFQQLLRLKQIELTLKPTEGVRDKDDPFPLDLSLSDFGEAGERLFYSLPDTKKMATRIARSISPDDLLSGRITAETLVKRVHDAWEECEIEARVQDLIQSDEMVPLLQVLASRISSLLPSAGEFPAGLLLCPPDAACQATIKGYEAASGLSGQYVLVEVDDCGDLSWLEIEEGATDG